MVSQLADQRVLGQFALAGIAAVSWIAFASGAACTTLMVNYMRRRGARNLFAVTLLAEVLLILLFGKFGGTLPQHQLAVITLCHYGTAKRAHHRDLSCRDSYHASDWVDDRPRY